MSPLDGPSHAPRPRRTGAWGAALLLAALALTATGCSSGTTATPGTPAAAADVKLTDPGTVAVQYSTALFSAQFERASAYVLPRERGVLKVLFTGMTSSSVRAENLGVGSVATKADSATVVMTGRMCSAPVVPKGATVDPRKHEKCIENHQRDSSDPAFKVAVCKNSGKWYVCFPKFEEAMQNGSQGSQGSAGSQGSDGSQGSEDSAASASVSPSAKK
ncbi:hypothetical protein GQF42_14235 [Streptomyces broussonetiae]|uniref:Uncharacterized protein n=1 Tax=Streptomyces broussonetiae TaxID=2686304 RepID=A0A6I6N1J5_9ACTN|nr:hypothetical protein [Streptomyces broussonetiae]QHA04291.1 hypothetical protein GQF42_14235 [Streptomyces broussonetiae]